MPHAPSRPLAFMQSDEYAGRVLLISSTLPACTLRSCSQGRDRRQHRQDLKRTVHVVVPMAKFKS